MPVTSTNEVRPYGPGNPDPACDAPPESPASYEDGHCRCVICARCHHHTGNSHQGHYWSYCRLRRGPQGFHFCCPDPAFGCSLDMKEPTP
jgi:hypothetical protein